MELHPSPGVTTADPSEDAWSGYLKRLPLDEASRAALLAHAPQGRQQTSEAIAALRAALDEDAELSRPTAPPIRRKPMAPESWPPSAFSRNRPRPLDDEPRAPRWRRFLLLLMVLGQTLVATYFMREVLPYNGQQKLEIVVLVLFAILFLWLSAGFWTAAMGFFQLLTNKRHYLASRVEAEDATIARETRIAVVMPICNEDVARVYAGLGATYRSLAATGELDHFDFYILSDSSDADRRVAELAAWFDMCTRLNGFGRIHYRRRVHRLKKKSGNVADFCRRWGANHDYMIVMDADSVMTGESLVTLTRMMEACPNAGIIQSSPKTIGRDTLYARAQQFASRVYGPLFVAGLHFWQLGESHYWGHNAIIRVKPFMEHCALGRMPGRGALAGDILSHDFVEAALMRRAGWAVWIAYDLPGSYEESPPTLIDDLKRDRRWCYGNLMNFRLFPEPSFHPVHRAVFVTGAFSYVSAPLWFLFLVASTALLAVHTLVEPRYFMFPNQLFPFWPQWKPQNALMLVVATSVLLFAPKLMSYLLVFFDRPRQFGGRLALFISMLVETLVSALLAPIRMLFHTQFVCAALMGRSINWKSPLREDAATGWREAMGWHGLHMLLGLGWAGLVYWLNPGFLWWLLPIVGAMALSVPISVYSSRGSVGRLLRRMKLLLIPEETDVPRELRWTQEIMQATPPLPGFAEAVLDPALNALVCNAARRRQRPLDIPRRAALVERALAVGPQGLDDHEKNTLLGDALAMLQLHLRLWTGADRHDAWHAMPTPAEVPRISALRTVPCC